MNTLRLIEARTPQRHVGTLELDDATEPSRFLDDPMLPCFTVRRGRRAKGIAVKKIYRGVLAAGLVLSGVSVAQPAFAARNVLLIILDDVGAEEIRSYARDLYSATKSSNGSASIKDTNANGYPDGLEDADHDGNPDGSIGTPTIDTLASAGVRFTQVWSNPVCSPTRAGIYTGRYGIHHGIGAPLGGSTMIWTLPSDVTTLAEQLTAQHSTYSKGLFGKWHLGEMTGTLPTDRGWDYFAGVTAGQVTSYYGWDKVTVDEYGVRTDTHETEYVTTTITNDAIAWISRQTGSWWATVAMNAAHTPYEAPPSFCLSGKISGSDNTALFHKTIECADYHIASLLASIDSATLANTTIVFVGDNGTEGGVTQVYDSSRAKGAVYQGGVHVPLIVADGAALAGRSGSGTGTITSVGRTVSSITSTVDIFSTLAQIMGVSVSSTDAVSLVTYLQSTSATAARTYSYTDAFKYTASQVTALQNSLADPANLTTANVATLTKTNIQGAIRSSQYKLIYTNGSYKLYDLLNDPFEQSNKWCASQTYKTQAQTLITALRAIDTTFPTKRCQ